MTEDEAKTKWCPKYQVATSGGDQSTFESDNRPPEHDMTKNPPVPTGRVWEGARCIGSACMAWRWDNPTPAEREHIRASMRLEVAENVCGHCGLAGKP